MVVAQWVFMEKMSEWINGYKSLLLELGIVPSIKMNISSFVVGLMNEYMSEQTKKNNSLNEWVKYGYNSLAVII